MTLEQRLEAIEKEVKELKMQLDKTDKALSCIDSSVASDIAKLSQAIAKPQQLLTFR